MTQFESPIKHIPFAQQKVYDKLSDLNNLESLKGRLPEDKISNLKYDTDVVSFDISMLGSIELKVEERTPAKCVKFVSTISPIPLTIWIQIVPVSEEECKIKITTGVDVNPFMKSVISKPINEGLEKFVEVLSLIQY
jgi:hypothetical protein